MSEPAPQPLMPLDIALQRHFPHGGVSKATMLAAIHRGDLGAEKIGRAYFVTDDDISAWRRKCRRDATAGEANQRHPNLLPDGSLSLEERMACQARAFAVTEAIKSEHRKRSSKTK